MANSVTVVRAQGDLTFSGNAADTEIVTIAGKAYTFQATLTDVDGNVLVGADAEESIDHLVAAINLDAAEAGDGYAASMTRNPGVVAEKISTTVLRVYAVIPGELGNLIDTTETGGSLAWGAPTLGSVSGNTNDRFRALIDENRIQGHVLYHLYDLTEV